MKSFILLLCLCAVSMTALGDARLRKNATYECHVKRVFDGDSVSCWVLRGRLRQGARIYRAFNFRVAGIDAPERGTRQPYWSEAQAALAAQLRFGEKVVVTVVGYDGKWKRNLISGEIKFADGRVADVAELQLAQGCAWFYRQYGRSLSVAQRESYAQAEANAQSQHVGLWTLLNPPIPPWHWRKGARPVTRFVTTPSGPFK